MKFIVILFLILTLSSVPLKAASAEFDYSDFGPQVASYEIIGYEWYQWQSVGGDDPKKKYDVKVVVYWGESLKDVKARYPVNPSKNQDFRYLRYEQARRHIRSLIQEFEEDRLPVDVLQKTLIKLDKIKPEAEPGGPANAAKLRG